MCFVDFEALEPAAIPVNRKLQIAIIGYSSARKKLTFARYQLKRPLGSGFCHVIELSKDLVSRPRKKMNFHNVKNFEKLIA
ncbi:hypothetical protein ACU8KH_01920 [Lachancea thermotolerans]